MGAHRCCVSGCPSRRKEVRMHKFPTDNATNRERVKIWINHCRREGWQPKNRNAIICDKHFDISQYEIHRIDRPPDNRKLRQTAIPTLFPGVPEPPKIPKQKVKPVRKPKPTNQLEESNQESSDAQKPSGIPGEKVQLIRTLKPTDRLEESNNDCPDVPELPTPREKVKPVRKSKCTDQREKSTCKSPDTSKPPRISGRKLKPIKKPKLTEYQFEELNYETKVVDWESLVNINIEVNGDEINNTDASDKKHQRQKRGQKAAKTKSLEKATEDEELIMNEEYDFFNDNPTTHPIHEEIPLEISPPECSFIKVEEADYEFLDENQTAHLISEEITLEDLVQPESSIIKDKYSKIRSRRNSTMNELVSCKPGKLNFKHEKNE